MKRWISVASHLFAATTSFVTLSIVPVVAYGAIALLNAWQRQSDIMGDSTSILAVPLLSVLSAAVFSAIAAPALSIWGQKVSRRFGWGAWMFPLLAGCAAVVGFSFANALFALGWSSLAIVGSGLATSAALGTYWAPLRCAQKLLPNIDSKCGQMRSRLNAPRRPVPISLS